MNSNINNIMQPIKKRIKPGVLKENKVICSDGTPFTDLESAELYENVLSKDKQIETLRKELKSVHQAYLSGMKLRDAEIDELLEINSSLEKKNDDIIRENNAVISDNLLLNNSLRETKKSEINWIGRTLKFQYLFNSMKKIGLKQSDDIFECFEDIEVPDVSIHIKDQFIPTEQTDNTDYDDDDEFIDEDEEPDIIGYYNDNNLSENMRLTLDISEFWSATIIQRFWRGYIARIMYKNKIKINELKLSLEEQLNRIESYRKDQSSVKSIIIIQRIWRGYLGRERHKILTIVKNDFSYDLHKSATIIQKIWRGYNIREKVKEFDGLLYLLHDYIMGFIHE
jgi:hypothetical protein